MESPKKNDADSLAAVAQRIAKELAGWGQRDSGNIQATTYTSTHHDFRNLNDRESRLHAAVSGGYSQTPFKMKVWLHN